MPLQTTELQLHANLGVFRNWCEQLPAERWLLYREIFTEAARREIPFAIGGGLALMCYAGQIRDTKDIDLYIQPQHREPMIEITRQAGLQDYYEKQSYDRKWIYRSCREDLIVDVMWAMANQRTEVDAGWLRGPGLWHDGVTIRFVPPEETLWSKLYVLQRDRCDWPDILNILYSVGPDLDWDRLLARVDEDAPLLAALVEVFRWVCPDRCRELPADARARLETAARSGAPGASERRANLLDTRPWFTPLIQGQQM